MANEAAMLNVVRERAGAEPLNGTVGIADVLAERARELYYEENRHVELVRISYLYAKTGKAAKLWTDVCINWITFQDRVVSVRTAKIPA